MTASDAAGPAEFLIIERDSVRVASGTRRAGPGGRLGRPGSAVLKGNEGAPREAVKLVPDDLDDLLELARSKLIHDLLGLPVLGDEVESRRDGFRHALFGGPFGPSVFERDSETLNQRTPLVHFSGWAVPMTAAGCKAPRRTRQGHCQEPRHDHRRVTRALG